METLKRQAKRIEDWLSKSEDKPGKMKKALGSNITDNGSAKMESFHGVILGYNKVSAVD